MARGLRRHTTTIVLSVLVAAAGVGVLVLDRGTVSTTEAERRKGSLFDAWRGDDVSRLVITREGETARLARDLAVPGGDGPGPWRVTIDGAEHAGDEQAIDGYLGKLEFAMMERRIAAGSIDREAFGLTAPRMTIEVGMDRLTHRLAIGGPAPTPAGASYAEVEGGGVYVVTSQLVAALDEPPEALRSRTFVPYLSVDLATIELSGEGGARRLERAPWGGTRGSGFRFAAGTADDPALGPVAGRRVNAASLDLVLASLGAMQADAFLTEAQAAAAGKKGVTIRLVPKDTAAPEGVIELGGACPDREGLVVAIRSAPGRAAACVSDELEGPLAMPLAKLVDTKLFGAPLDEVTDVKLEEGERSLEIARSGYGWRERSPTERDVAADVGRAFVDALLRTRVTRFVTGEARALGLDPPRATVRVVSVGEGTADGGRDRVETVEIGAERDGVVHVRRLEDGAVGALEAGALGRLLPGDLALRPRAVLDERPAQIQAIRVEQRLGEGLVRTQRLARDEDEALHLIEPRVAGLEIDTALARDAATAIAGLTAEGWASDHDDGSFGLGEPRVVVEAKLVADVGAPSAGADRAVRILLGAPTASGSYAKLDGDPAVFIAPRSFEDAVTRWLFDRGALRIDPDEVRRVTLAPAGAKRVVIERSGDGAKAALRVVGSDGADALAKAAAVRDALADLDAETVVTVGKAAKSEGLDPPALTIAVERGAGGAVQLAIGAGDTFRGTRVYYVRKAGVDATFAIAQAKVQPLLDAAR